MKEFIDKLIERLEESKEMYEDVAFFEMNTNGHTLDFEYSHGKEDGVSEAIQIVNELAEEYKLFGNSEQVKVSEMPTGWIPVSERLPEPGKRYLVSSVWKDKDFKKHSVYDAVYGTDGIWHTYEYKPTMYKVIAWCELPAPYTEGE